jgi:hypothetical protein
MDEQVKVLKAITDNIGACINKGYLPRALVWQSLHSQVWPSICYPLAAMMIMKEESEEITKYLYSQLLPSGGANCHFPLVYCRAPLAFFGLNLLQSANTQFIEQVKWVLVRGIADSHWQIF